jgi:cobalamin biosynthesis protein CobT
MEPTVTHQKKKSWNLDVETFTMSSDSNSSPTIDRSVISMDSFSCGSMMDSEEDRSSEEDQENQENQENQKEPSQQEHSEKQEQEGEQEDQEEQQERTQEERNEQWLEMQIRCIEMNNENLEKQYHEMVKMGECMKEQEKVYQHNQNVAITLLAQINEYQLKSHTLQQQIYYQRHELDRMAEQVLMYEGIMEKNKKTIREQEEEMNRNHQALEYDKNVIGSFGKVFDAFNMVKTVNMM